MIAAIRKLPRTVWLLGIISLVNDAASDMIYPLVPLYLASVLMAGPKALGIIEGIAEAVSSLLKLFAGVLADRTRHVKYWVFAGYGIAGFARPLLGLTGPEIFDGVRCPVLVTHGSDDRVIPHETGAEAARLTGGTLITFEGSGHIPNARDPVRFNLALRRFVETVRP